MPKTKQSKIRTYDTEFKLNAVKLCLSKEKSYSAVSQELGVPMSTLTGWVYACQNPEQATFPGKGNLSPHDQELAKIRKELAIVTEERDILKKALGIFSSRRA